MPKFKVRLTAPVTITASLDFVMEAENEDKAYEQAFDEYQKIMLEYNKIYQLYRQGKATYPSAPFYWTVDQDDVESNLHDRDIEVDDITEVEE